MHFILWRYMYLAHWNYDKMVTFDAWNTAQQQNLMLKLQAPLVQTDNSVWHLAHKQTASEDLHVGYIDSFVDNFFLVGPWFNFQKDKTWTIFTTHIYYAILILFGKEGESYDLVWVTLTAMTVTTITRRDMMMNGSQVFKKPPILSKLMAGGEGREGGGREGWREGERERRWRRTQWCVRKCVEYMYVCSGTVGFNYGMWKTK